MNRREVMQGAVGVVAAAALSGLSGIEAPVERMWTYVSIWSPSFSEGISHYGFTKIGWVFHKPDLSDLGEPYLSAVSKALAENNMARGISDNGSANFI